MDNLADKDAFVEALLQERDELYQELSKLRQIDGGALAQAEKKIAQFQKAIEEKDRLIKKLTDQLAWLRRMFWKASSEIITYKRKKPDHVKSNLSICHRFLSLRD